MLEEIALLDKTCAESPILLPQHPYVVALKDFGLDELIAGGVDALSTTMFSFFLDEQYKKAVLPFVGPVLEKVGFFPAHFWQARKLYRTLPEEKREKFSFYYRKALKDGAGNLTKDVLVHDPIYISMMLGGLEWFPFIPPGVLSGLSYVTGIALVAGIDVARQELGFNRTKKELKKAGFENEKYLESRFYVRADKDPNEIVDLFVKKFGLSSPQTLKYSDTYYPSDLPSFSGRTGKLRIRSRQRRPEETKQLGYNEDSQSVNSIQIVYTRAREEKKGVDQCRYFPVSKDKFYFVLPNDIPTSIETVQDEQIRRLLSGYVSNKKQTKSIEFERTIANNGELAVCTDKIQVDRPFYVVELKVYKDTTLLQQAMRYMMVECPLAAVQTTHSKSRLLNGF